MKQEFHFKKTATEVIVERYSATFEAESLAEAIEMAKSHIDWEYEKNLDAGEEIGFTLEYDGKTIN